MPHFRLINTCTCLILALAAFGQRTYKPASVLASGNWYKISVEREGVYRLDVSFLNSLGITGSIASAQVRLFGNGGGMLPESNTTERIDDLQEVALWVEDGGDGILNGNDHVLFYAPGPDRWITDSVSQRFRYQKNLYSSKAFYYLSIGGSGKRIVMQGNAPTPAVIITSFDERYHYELDSINFLNSGKEWFGEEFSNLPGRSLSRTFSLPLSDFEVGNSTIAASFAARSINAASQFNVSVNSQQVGSVGIAGVTPVQYGQFAQTGNFLSTFPLNSSTASVSISYAPGSINSQGWLNWFEFFVKRRLNLPLSKQLFFRSWNSMQTAAEYRITGADAGTQVWDVSEVATPVKMGTSISGNQVSFSVFSNQLREYVVFAGNYLTPIAEGRVPNQNLHNTSEVDYLIVTHPLFKPEADRLASFHVQRDLRVQVVTTDQIFNEFSGGTPDPSAIRDFVKMYFDKYRSTWYNAPKYLLLFGKGSFDYKNRLRSNTNFVPVYESAASLDPLATYTSDDFFGFLEDHEDINSTLLINTLDIGIGRIPAVATADAKAFVDKVYSYHAPESFGWWRNQMDFVADDEDQNLHLQDAEVLTTTVQLNAPVFNPQKIYLDAYRQESGSAGGRYPQANAVINNNIYNGTLLWNYSGHGGPNRLAEEVVLDQSIVNSWQNKNRLPLFITATCDFAPYDNPYQTSLGENLLIRPVTGAIALLTTSRVVFSFSNRIMNDNYLRLALQRDSAGKYKTLGESIRAAKNFTYQNFGDINNNRKFSLLGDPAMTIAYPTLNVVATEINGRAVTSSVDTLKATNLVTVRGEVRDFAGTRLQDFHGTATVALLDKPGNVTTLANDAGSIPAVFAAQSAVLFRGKATVNSGAFYIEFRLPKDINYQFGRGKLSLYAADGRRDGNGYTTNVVIGGIGNAIADDKEGPEIRAYLNDEKFVSGGITNASPVLVVKLSDSSGINSGGAGIDHDIVATLDGDQRQYFVLNNFYESDVDDYRRGTVRFQLPQLSPGQHSIQIKAWDVLNNSSTHTLNFTVVEDGQFRIDHVLNYPNPFTTRTAFWFEHNLPGVDLQAKVEVFTIAGKLIKTIVQTINSTGNRSSDIEWNGADEYGSRIGRGIYLYRIRISAPDGRSAEKWEKLAIL